MSEKYNELKLYSPLTAELVENEPDLDWDYFDVADYAQNLDGQYLVYFRDIIEHQIPENVMIKLHTACVDLYNTQLPLKPLERDLRLSRQTMRNEIEYHTLFIPKKTSA